MLQALSTLPLRRRRGVLIASAAAVLLMIGLAAGAFSVLKDGGFDDPSSGSSRALKILDGASGGRVNLLLLVTPRDARGLDSPEVTRAADGLVGQLQRRGDVTAVSSYWAGHAGGLAARDRRSGIITMHVQGDDVTRGKRASSIITTVTRSSSIVQVRAGGELGVDNDLVKGIGSSLALAEAIAVPLTLLLLVVAFGSVLAALLPLGIGLVAVAGTFAELAVLGRLTDVSIYALNLTTALGLGLAVDYSLLMVSRFREELRAGRDVDEAVSRTIATAGRTIVFSSATVAAALGALLLFPVYFLRSFAYAGIGVVVVAMAASLITLPALLATFGTRLAYGRRPSHRSSDQSPFWRRVAATVTSHPAITGVPVVLGLLVLGSPFTHVRFGTPDDRVQHTSVASRQVGDLLRTEYDATAASPIEVLLMGSPSTTAVDVYARRLSDLPDVNHSNSPLMRTMHPAGTVQLTIDGPSDSSSARSQDLVRAIRAVPAPAGSDVLVGGAAAALVDSKAAIAGALPAALLWICLTTLALLFLFTGSVLLPVKALALNGLSLTAVFGILVWVFQDGHLSGLLGFTPTPVNTAMIVLLFCVSFGLSMDYEVFLLARIKEAHDQGAGTTEAVITGLGRTGRIVTTAAALLSITFFAFGTAQISFLQLFGIGTGIAIVLDATIIRGILVPAIMRLAGESNWWAPGPLRQLHSRFSLHHPDELPATLVKTPTTV